MRTVVLVSGSGSNLQAIIDRARAGDLDVRITGVISDRPGIYALERAREASIPALAIDYKAAGSRGEFTRRLDAQLESLDPELIVLAGFMRILPPDLVDRYRGRMLNVHPSLLPKYPGLDTYRRVLAAGDDWHGTTVHFVIPELDAGPCIIQYRVRIHPGESEDSLRQRVQRGEYLIYPQAIQWVATGRVTHRDGQAWKDGRRMETPEVVDETISQPVGES
jgi:phosphoribosylglycinamide formyltransferase-1